MVGSRLRWWRKACTSGVVDQCFGVCDLVGVFPNANRLVSVGHEAGEITLIEATCASSFAWVLVIPLARCRGPADLSDSGADSGRSQGGGQTETDG